VRCRRRSSCIEQIYFAEINAGGQSYATTGSGYNRSYKAIETLFPGSVIGGTTTAYNGSLSLYQNARIRTDQGGALNVLAPGGGVTLGLENQTPDLTGLTDTARPGLLTLEGGDINIFTDQSVIVAQPRIFTELGGDITVWSTNGDINAGKGKQTSIITSPPNILYDNYANVTKTPATPQTGAGIATLIGVPGVPPGNVDLFGPHGTIDAGEAGIRVSGNFTVAALQIVLIGGLVAATTAAITQHFDDDDRGSVVIVVLHWHCRLLGCGGGVRCRAQRSDRRALHTRIDLCVQSRRGNL
jgi:filamentous hemagglutinin